MTKITKFFHRRTLTQDFVIKNGKVFLKSCTQDFMTENDKVFFLGEVVPNIWWVQTRTLILLSTISPGEVVPQTPGEILPNFRGTSSPGYELSWVRALLGTTSPDTLYP
jgi:hypothetical protein